VTPSGVAISDGNDNLELATAARFGQVTRGTLDGWEAVAAAAEVKGCPHFLLGVLSGFAGVVQSLCALDSCGINLSCCPSARAGTILARPCCLSLMPA
jgi:hypothetical protein